MKKHLRLLVAAAAVVLLQALCEPSRCAAHQCADCFMFAISPLS